MSNRKKGKVKEQPTLLSKYVKFYSKEYKRLLTIPIAMLLFTVIVLYSNYARTGDLFSKDVSLSGGMSITFNVGEIVSIDKVTMDLENMFPQSSLNIRELDIGGMTSGIIIEDSNPQDEKSIVTYMKNNYPTLTEDDINVETMGTTLGNSFFKEMFLALFFAFICMGLVFFYYFKALIPTLAALASAFSDIFITLGIIVFIGMRLTSGGIAAFLMLIGYSIDTSILLSTKTLKGDRKHLDTSIEDAMKTALTMSAAGLAAMGISFLLTNNITLKQIMLILVIGLIIDIITTWLINCTLLKMYITHTEKR